MKNKVSLVIFSIALCSAWNMVSAMERVNATNKKSEEKIKEQQLQQLHSDEVTEGDSDDDSVAEARSSVAGLILQEGVGPQEKVQASQVSPENFIYEFQTILTGAGFKSEEQHDLHGCLKRLQQASFGNYKTVCFYWNNERQQFLDCYERPTQDLTDLEEEVLEVLNGYVTYDRKKRRADVPTWQEQDRSQPSLLATFLSPGINLQQLRFQIAHQNREEIFGSQPPHQGDIALPQDHSILLYGFNVPGKAGPRLQVKEKLQTLFKDSKIQAMNDYNKAIGLSASGIKFSHYLAFIGGVKKRILKNLIEDNALGVLPISRLQAEAWALFLENHLQKFDFSRKLISPETKARFIAKNYKNITTNSGLSQELQRAFNAERLEWNFITDYLEPIFVYLHNVHASLINRTLEDAAIDQALAALGTQAEFLDLQIPAEKQKDLKLVLDSIVSEAFFRTTSKLGLKFAQEQNIQVAFVWTHAFSPLDPPPLSSLKEFQDYIEKKPYYKGDFRMNSRKYKYPEAITCSEARQLGLLKATNTAPDFLLIRKIFSDIPH